MEVPKEVRKLYSLLNDEQIEYIKNQYYCSVSDRLYERRIQFENDYITIDEFERLENIQKEEAIAITNTIRRNEYLDREVNINQNIRFYIRLVLFFDYYQLLQSYEAKQEQNRPTISPTDKIAINGNYQMLMFLFSELINKGYITAPKHNGKTSHKQTAEMLLRHFEFTNKEQQPTAENLTQYLKNNQYSLEKQGLFKIPKMETAND